MDTFKFEWTSNPYNRKISSLLQTLESILVQSILRVFSHASVRPLTALHGRGNTHCYCEGWATCIHSDELLSLHTQAWPAFSGHGEYIRTGHTPQGTILSSYSLYPFDLHSRTRPCHCDVWPANTVCASNAYNLGQHTVCTLTSAGKCVRQVGFQTRLGGVWHTPLQCVRACHAWSI